MTTTKRTTVRPTVEIHRGYERGDTITVAEARAREAKAATMAGFVIAMGAVTLDNVDHVLAQPGVRLVLANTVARGEKISDETWASTQVIVTKILEAQALVAQAGA